MYTSHAAVKIIESFAEILSYIEGATITAVHVAAPYKFAAIFSIFLYLDYPLLHWTTTAKACTTNTEKTRSLKYSGHRLIITITSRPHIIKWKSRCNATIPLYYLYGRIK